MNDWSLPVFFSSWESLLRIVVVGFSVYFSMLVLLRVAGKRTLAKMSAFDLVVTVALGSVLATSLLSPNVRMLDGVTAFVVLVVAQRVVTFFSSRSAKLRDLLQSRPALLYFQGRYLNDAMQRERVAKEELHAAVRQQGVAAMSEVSAVVLETDGSFSVLTEIRDAALFERVRDAMPVRGSTQRAERGA